LTRTIVGTERDALAAVRLLTDWVYRYLRKVPTATLPDAIAVLDLGQGDCNEHAVLLAALCRAAGIPSRVAGGLVYGEDAFLYHAWTDVWLGAWVPVDAALNQVPADATHVRLAEGSDYQHLMMMGLIRDLSIEIVDGAAGGR
jgi:transglutaminase-like putative cysteine protease